MSSLISQHSLLPVDGMRASQSPGVKENCNSQMKRIQVYNARLNMQELGTE